jgi:hypothetical protein
MPRLQVDKTVLFTIGAVAGPVAQHLVDGSVLVFTEADITQVFLHTLNPEFTYL